MQICFHVFTSYTKTSRGGVTSSATGRARIAMYTVQELQKHPHYCNRMQGKIQNRLEGGNIT